MASRRIKWDFDCPVLTGYVNAVYARRGGIGGFSDLELLELEPLAEIWEDASKLSGTSLLRGMSCFGMLCDILLQQTHRALSDNAVGLYQLEALSRPFNRSDRQLTREELTATIKKSRETELTCISILTAGRVNSARSQYNRIEVYRLRELARLVHKAGVFLRPRLRNGKSVARIAAHLVTGMTLVYCNTFDYIRVTHALINTTTATGPVLSHGVWGFSGPIYRD